MTMARPDPLTPASVRKEPHGAERTEVPDGSTPGLYLVVQPSGHKSYAFRYHRPGSRNKTAKLTLGTADITGLAELAEEPAIGGHLTLAAARLLAAQVRRQLALGNDPAAERREARSKPKGTFAEVARRYIEEHAKAKIRRWEELAKMIGIDPVTRAIRRGSYAWQWAQRDPKTITADDIFHAVEAATARGIPGMPARATGASPGRGRHVHSMFSGLFGWMVERRIVTVNPAKGLARPDAADDRDRVLTDEELRWLWAATEVVGYPYGPLVRMLAITGTRLRECAEMTRSELSGDTWTIPGARTKNGEEHVLVLPPMAMQIIESIGHNHEPLFTDSGTSPVTSFSRAKARIDAEMERLSGAPVVDWRLHDLRRVFSVGMARLGVKLEVSERALNHVSGSFAGVAGVYNRYTYREEVGKALAAWAAMLERIVTGQQASVTPLFGR
jgi:integrase